MKIVASDGIYITEPAATSAFSILRGRDFRYVMLGG
jgi:hypothetical protein